MDNIFFLLSKTLWFFISPDHLVVLALLGIFILFMLKKDQLAKKYFLVLSSFILLIAIFPVGNWLLYPLETQFSTQPKLPQKVDGIILMGGSFKSSNSHYWGSVQTNHYADRIFTFLALIQKYPNAKAIFTGGQASLLTNHPSEAFYARQLFQSIGIKEGRIIFEDQARNTYENSLFAKKLAQPKQGETWVVVSSAFHLPRTVGVFCQQQWPVIPYPADFHSNSIELYTPALSLSENILSLDQAIHEWLGLFAYYFTNKLRSWLPKSC